MLLNLVADIAKLSLFAVGGCMLLVASARHRRPQWTEHQAQRRLAAMGILTVAVGGIRLIDDVVAQECCGHPCSLSPVSPRHGACGLTTHPHAIPMCADAQTPGRTFDCKAVESR